MVLASIEKMLHIGLKQTVHVLKNRIVKRHFAYQWRERALNRTASYSWHETVKQYDVGFQFSRSEKKPLSFLDGLYADQPIELVIAQANLFADNTFDLLGSGPTTFDTMPWHTDFRLRKQNPHADCQFDPDAFFCDIAISVGMTFDLAKDIKVPWELSRFEHLLVVGKAYAASGDELYARVFVDHIVDWKNQNLFLVGVNWVCPMEVAIRAINWICAEQYFSNSSSIPDGFWHEFKCSLYDHMIYLEHNWELYDSRTSNHYLSNLVGYLYLCYFFKYLPDSEKKIAWCYREILHEFEKQVFDEGTDYEGSTRYHQLVTELFFHAYLLFGELGLRVTPSFEKKLSAMFEFIRWTDGISVGDHDSGTILYYGITPSIIERMSPRLPDQAHKNFEQFGISFLKKDSWQISMRHHVYNKRQPSGHFHNDAGSITVAKNGIPLIVDPGSYVYTPSAVWRNYFRSVENHNSFFIPGSESMGSEESLFASHILPAEYSNGRSLAFETEHSLYANEKNRGLSAHRTLSCNGNTVVITDWWHNGSNEKTRHDTCWNYTFAHGLTVVHDGDRWSVMKEGSVLLSIYSQAVIFEITDGWVSPGYGIKLPCKQLKAKKNLETESSVITIIEW